MRDKLTAVTLSYFRYLPEICGYDAQYHEAGYHFKKDHACLIILCSKNSNEKI